MAKFEVTPELASILKSTRVQHGVSAKSVATLIGKSQSYLSKLEKGDIKKIDEEELTAILKYIFREDQESLDGILEKIYESIDIQFTDEEIKNQLWWDNYDTVLRLIPVPEDLIDDIIKRISSLGISIAYLCKRINANEGIFPTITNEDHYPFNQWQALIKNHTIAFYFIKMSVSEQRIVRLLNKEDNSANYVTILSIAYYLRKIELYGEKTLISEDDSHSLSIYARDYLNKYKFFSIQEKTKLRKEAKTDSDRDQLVSSFDLKNRDLINHIIISCKLFSELDIRRSNEALERIVKNLDWDVSFMMAIWSMRYDTLGDLSYSHKMKLLSDIKEVLNKYIDIPKEQRALNQYDLT